MLGGRLIILPLVLVIAGALAVARGGSLQTLAATHFELGPVLFAGLALQLGFDIWSPAWLTRDGALGVLIVSNVAVIAFLAMNRRLPGLWLASLGLLLNLVVIGANGAMPVSVEGARAAGLEAPPVAGTVKHERVDENTELPWLADVIPLPGMRQILSLGDFALILGLARLVYARARAGGFSPDQNRSDGPVLGQRKSGVH